MDISESIKFKDICSMLEKVKNAVNVAAKEKYLRRYYDSFCKYRHNYRQENGIGEDDSEEGNTSFYCVLRCLIPGSDSVRPPYGLQITSLGKVYIKVLQLSEDSRDVQRLIARSYSGIRGDYADIVHTVLSPRCKQEPSNVTLKQVHDMLDTIASDDRRNTEKVLTQLSEIASAKEQMWFIRLLLKSMHLGIGEQKIFNILHVQAKDIFRRCSNLKRVCCLLADNKIAEASNSSNNNNIVKEEIKIESIITVFQHIRPMLCEMFPGDIQPLMSSDVLFLETKMDGERFQLHYTNDQFKYISRNGVDYTSSFGENYNDGNLTPHLVSLLPIGMESIIIDGEMMVYDTNTARFCDKGENTDVKHLGGRPHWRPCFVAYDLLYFNGCSYLDTPYIQRMTKLKELIKEEVGILQVMKPKKVSSMEDFKKIFQEALDAGEEGVVLKKQSSLYKPGIRHVGGWYKVKADYIQGLTTEFDLLVIGGFYNRTRTFIESFLVGVLNFKGEDNYEVYSVGKVTNNTRQRIALNETLKPLWHKLTSDPPPMTYRYVHTNPEGRPDVWIEANKSIILQIKAADLAPSSAFFLSKSLHFPRTEAWRNDKVWNECMTLKEFLQMCQSKKGLKKINKRELQVEDFTTNRKRLKMTATEKRKIGIKSYEKIFNAEEIEQSSELFGNFSFCVLSGSLKEGQTVHQLKYIITENGGEIVENPIPTDSRCICVAGDITHRIDKMIKTNRYNIVSILWLLRTTKAQEMTFRPKDMICATDEVREQFKTMFDKYGDSYTEFVGPNELKELFDEISLEELNSFELTDEAVEELENELYKKKSPYYFRNHKAYFYSNELSSQIAKYKFQLHGGIVENINAQTETAGIEYIFIDEVSFNKADFKDWLKKVFKSSSDYLHIVKVDWVLQSHSKKTKLDVFDFTWHDFS
ncbi:DNA ligase 4-like [Teleopsis dalmanni]|uniref:DNA ligase 4-like n=1 Tax=Teleopsis dalmanni TaxID=139649 RepID=UPI0018CF0687|nr:DNA ligase 4-like [Teleopsis dalmanni]